MYDLGINTALSRKLSHFKLESCSNYHIFIWTEEYTTKGKSIRLYAYYACSLQYRNFFPFFFFPTYVGFVQVSDVLAIFVTDRRCEFW